MKKTPKPFWNKITGIITAIMLIGGLLAGYSAFMNNIATANDLKQTEQRMAQALNIVKNSIQIQTLTNRIQSLVQQERQLKLELKRSPRDQEVKDMLVETQKEKDEAKEDLKNLLKVQ